MSFKHLILAIVNTLVILIIVAGVGFVVHLLGPIAIYACMGLILFSVLVLVIYLVGKDMRDDKEAEEMTDE